MTIADDPRLLEIARAYHAKKREAEETARQCNFHHNEFERLRELREQLREELRGLRSTYSNAMDKILEEALDKPNDDKPNSSYYNGVRR